MTPDTETRLIRAEILADAAAERATTVEERAAAAVALAAVVEARVAYQRRSLGTDPRAPLFVGGSVGTR